MPVSGNCGRKPPEERKKKQDAPNETRLKGVFLLYRLKRLG